MLFRAPALTAVDDAVLRRLREQRERLRYLVGESRQWTGVLRRVSMARAVRGSNSIEGIHASVEDTAAILRAEEPRHTPESTAAAIAGYRDAMTYVVQVADDPHVRCNRQLLLSLHFMAMKHDPASNPGRIRPRQVYVRDERTGEQVYEAAPVDDIPALLDELTAAMDDDRHTPLVVAAIAHLNLAMVHPFRDGNGRMARIVQSLVLTREGLLAPEFCSIEEELGRATPAYHDALAATGGPVFDPSRDTLQWVRFVLDAHHRQQVRLLRRADEAERAWELLAELAARRGLVERMLPTLLDATAGREVRNPDHAANAEVTAATASRDLKAMVDAGLLEPRGEKRGRSYVRAAPLSEIHARVTEGRAIALGNVYDVVADRT